MEALRRAAPQGGLTCTSCLRNWPHFDSLHEDLAFAALMGDMP